jgi:outer membrane cobalamin receptor
MRGDNMKILSAAIGAILALALSAMEAGAQTKAAERQVELAIEQQSLADALNEWAKQTGLQLVSSSSEMLNTIVAPRVKGPFTPSRALDELLKGTPLTYVWVSERAVAIQERTQVLPAALRQTSEDASPPFAVARFSAGDAQYPRASVHDDAVAQTNVGERANQASPRAAGDVDQLEEIIVTGTHIRGLENPTSPVIVLSRSYIESTGLSTTSRLIESLPQNFALTSQAGVLVPGVSSSSEQGSSINLRGIGEGTTLVLLNGRRMASGFIGSAADISALPLSVIDRVEVLTDGASAIYGSDAVGGVVNFILRRDFQGAETQLRAGYSDGVNEYRASQALGSAWDSGNAMISLEYYKRDLLDSSERDFVPSTSGVGSLYPDDKNYSGMLSARQNLTNDIGVFADALFTRRDSYNEGGRISVNENVSTRNPQLTTALGLDWSIGRDWEVELSGSYARNKLEQTQRRSDADDFIVDTLFEIKGGELKADGGLWQLPGGTVRAAVGVDWRSETLSARSGRPAVSDGVSSIQWDQTVRSAFAEVHVPIVGADNALPAIKRLQFSLAGRYDDYSNFGTSFDPQVGLMWEPVEGFRLRATRGSSYKAPKLTDYDLRFNSAIALFFPDPQAASGTSHQLWITGADSSGYSPQESESWSLGFEFSRTTGPGLKFGLNYYDIEYRNRIADPQSPDVIIGNPASFGQLIIRDPTVQQVNDFIAIGDLGQGLTTLDPDFNIPDPNFTPDSVDVIVDTRRRNLSALDTSGLDGSIAYAFDVGDSSLEVGANGTYIFEIEQRATSTSAPFNTVDTVYNPPRLRARGNVAWRRQAWAANLFVNYTASYTDNRASSPVPVSSYTTLDAHLAYDFGKRAGAGFWSGVTLSFSAQNLFDKDPPSIAVLSDFRDMGFDPTNGNPLGRLIALQLAKTW